MPGVGRTDALRTDLEGWRQRATGFLDPWLAPGATVAGQR